MIANDMSPEEAADDWDLPLKAILEAIHYCETHQELLKQEAEEERYRLEQKESPLSLRLLVDEDSQAKRFVNLLKQAGHDVITVNEAGLMSKPDSVVLDYARQEGLTLLPATAMTSKPSQSQSSAFCILAVYETLTFSRI
jgi:hypothetical protein